MLASECRLIRGNTALPKLRLTITRPLSAGAEDGDADRFMSKEARIAEAMKTVDRSQEQTRTVPLALLKVGEENVRNGKLLGIGEWRHIAVRPRL